MRSRFHLQGIKENGSRRFMRRFIFDWKELFSTNETYRKFDLPRRVCVKGHPDLFECLDSYRFEFITCRPSGHWFGLCDLESCKSEQTQIFDRTRKIPGRLVLVAGLMISFFNPSLLLFFSPA